MAANDLGCWLATGQAELRCLRQGASSHSMLPCKQLGSMLGSHHSHSSMKPGCVKLLLQQMGEQCLLTASLSGCVLASAVSARGQGSCLQHVPSVENGLQLQSVPCCQTCKALYECLKLCHAVINGEHTSHNLTLLSTFLHTLATCKAKYHQYRMVPQ